jgi:chromosome segregation ATPase
MSMENEPDQVPAYHPSRAREGRRRSWPRSGAVPGTPVVRLDIYTSSEGVTARSIQPGADDGAEYAQLALRESELDRLASQLAERREHLAAGERTLKASLRELEEAKQAAAEREVEQHRLAAGARRELNAARAKLEQREREVAAREAELERAHTAEVGIADIEHRRRRLAAQEEALSERTHELRRLEQQIEDRDRTLTEREAEVRVAQDLKEEELEGREQTLAEQERRLTLRESDLTIYAGQLQKRLAVGKLDLTTSGAKTG